MGQRSEPNAQVNILDTKRVLHTLRTLPTSPSSSKLPRPEVLLWDIWCEVISRVSIVVTTQGPNGISMFMGKAKPNAICTETKFKACVSVNGLN